MSCHGVIIKRDVALDNPFREDRELAGSEDYELWLRLAAQYTIHRNPIVTSALVQHSSRSVFNFDPDKLIRRKELFLEYLESDERTMSFIKPLWGIVRSNAYLYLALHLAMNRVPSKSKALSSYFKAFASAPIHCIGRKTFYVIPFKLLRG